MRCFKLAGSVAALLAGLAVASVGFAQPPFGGHHRDGGHHRGHGPPGFIEEHATRIGLDDETQEAIETIVDESREQARKLHVELRGLHREMHDLLSQETPDEAAVMQQAEAIGAAETELHKHRLGTLIKIRALHTPEQRGELARIREETREKWLQPLIEACEADLDQFCPDEDGRWSRRRCLRDHWDELSSDCRDAIEFAGGEARPGPRGKPGRRGMGEF
jgi:Spy/CpxP family protein refolding chaperone